MLGIALLFTILCALFGAAFVAVCEKGQYRRAFWLKGLAGVCFVAAGLSFAIEQAGPAFPRLIFFGLVFGLIGDQLLALRFIHPERHDVFLISGAAAFAAGHGMYIAAMWSLDSGAWLFALVFLAVGLAAAYAYILRHPLRAGKLLTPAMIYIAFVVSVAALAASLLTRGQGTRALRLLLGGILFVISDCVLVVRSFSERRTTRQSVMIHGTYYAAQLLFAWSIAG